MKPEQWESPLVQEKYQEEKACDKRHPYCIMMMMMMMMMMITTTTPPPKEVIVTITKTVIAILLVLKYAFTSYM